MKNLFQVLVYILGFGSLALMCTIGVIQDNTLYKNTVKVYYNETDYSVEILYDRYGNPNKMFKEGCITDHYLTKICGIRKVELVKKEKL